MWFMNRNESEIVNSEYVERFVIVKRDDAVLIVASYGETRMKTLGRYRNEEEAGTALLNLFRAISENSEFYFMDSSTGCIEIKKPKAGYHGKKVKGHGGS